MILKNKSLIVYELNEVPKRVLDYYLLKRPKSNISKLCNNGFFCETYTNDLGELHPWSTWPSVHRGVTNDIHSINFLNQDKSCAKSFPPIWEVLDQLGISVGIFGSLQTYPPYVSENVEFFVPDTFSPESTSIPKELEFFQRFNLSLARKNKALAGQINFADIYNLLRIINKGFITKNTLWKVFIHLLKETFDNRYKKRRANIQALFAFDVYKKFLKKSSPRYSTFFTNHIAANMHRYWLHTFPDDFDLKTQKSIKDMGFNSLSILKAMDIADQQIGFLMNFQESRGGELWVISALGQEAIKRKKLKFELFLDDEIKFLKGLGLDLNDYIFIPSMFPDINVKCKDKRSALKLLGSINKLKDNKSNKLLRQRYQLKGNTLNLVIESKNYLNLGERIIFDKKLIPLNELGLRLISRDNGTGYHIKEGIFISNNASEGMLNLHCDNDKKQINICNFFKMTLNYFDLEKTI